MSIHEGAPARPGEVIATIRSLLPSLLPTEQAVAGVLLARSAEIVELSSQQVAELAGASRATVVRTCQSLGFSGYQQLRVLLARDAGYAGYATASRQAGDGGAGSDAGLAAGGALSGGAAGDGTDAAPGGAATLSGPAAIVGRAFRRLADGVGAMVALLDEQTVAEVVEALAGARRVIVLGNGLSAPLALDAAARLTAIGRPAEAPIDVINQQITARLLGPQDVVLAISGSGSNDSTLKAVRSARRAGAVVVLLTAFARSPLTQSATYTLVVTMPDMTFRDEVTLASRLPQAILIEGLVAALAGRLGEAAQRARALALDAVSENLAE